LGEAGEAAGGMTVRGRIVVAGLALAAVPAVGGSDALAQADAPAPGSIVRVADTDGQPLNLRVGPSTEQPILARLPVAAPVTVSASATGRRVDALAARSHRGRLGRLGRGRLRRAGARPDSCARRDADAHFCGCRARRDGAARAR
jgi:hypothetical protein